MGARLETSTKYIFSDLSILFSDKHLISRLHYIVKRKRLP